MIEWYIVKNKLRTHVHARKQCEMQMHYRNLTANAADITRIAHVKKNHKLKNSLTFTRLCRSCHSLRSLLSEHMLHTSLRRRDISGQCGTSMKPFNRREQKKAHNTNSSYFWPIFSRTRISTCLWLSKVVRTPAARHRANTMDITWTMYDQAVSIGSR